MAEGDIVPEGELLTPRETLLLGLGTFTEEEHIDVNQRVRDILYGFKPSKDEIVEIPDQDKLVALLLLERQLGDKFFVEFRDLPAGSEPSSASQLQRIRQSREVVENRMRTSGNITGIESANILTAKLQRFRTAGKGQGGTPAS